MSKSRDDIIDLQRSIAIVVFMFIAHFAMMSVEFDFPFPIVLRKAILLNETAIEGFMLFAGYAIGKYYLPKYKVNPADVTKKILIRTLKLIIIQYVMILTISFPHFLVTTSGTDAFVSLRFLWESITFYNQVGLIHILPTFIIMFLIAPVILYLLACNKGHLVLFISICVFVAAQADPYILNYGEKTIFPLVLFQVYFVIGCYLGMLALTNKDMTEKQSNTTFIVASLLMIIALIMKHRLALPDDMSNIIDNIDRYDVLYITRYPQNLPALFFALSTWFFIFQFCKKYWCLLSKSYITKYLLIFGRNPLLSFVIHVYIIKFIEIILSVYQVNVFLIYIFIAMNYVLGYLFLVWYERGNNNKNIKMYVKYLFG